jgi:RNA polymerase sigma-70 factor (ECF subfamily)
VPPTLLQRIAAGDQAAVRDCLDRYGGLVWALARRFLGDSAEAEDAVQEVFVELWRGAGRFDPAQSAEATFVTMIARRRLIDRHRRGRRRPGPEPLTLDPPARQPDAADRLEVQDEAGRAARALDQLRDDQRRVLRLAIYHGMSHDEIARATGLPLGTVKTHARRGLLRVRELLGAPATPAGAGKGGGA